MQKQKMVNGMKQIKIMNNWDKYKRMQCNMQKATYNCTVIHLMDQHYQHLHNRLVRNPQDEDIFNDTFLKMTYKYNPQKDFVEQFCWLFKQLKGAYFRDDKANKFYQIREDLLTIPDFIQEREQAVDTSIVNRLKSQLCHT